MSLIANKLGVEPPFITEMVNDLKDKNFIGAKKDDSDSRVKILFLTTKGKEFVKETEEYVSKNIRFLVGGVSASELVAYLSVLDKIVENGNKQNYK